MAEIILNVEVREGVGTGGARAARNAGKVPGVLYGGDKAPVAIAVEERAFKKSLYTGKLLGHLVTLQHGGEKQQVIAKDVQFHPVTDQPLHFDLYRVEKGQTIHINVPVHFRNEDDCPALRQGGALEIVSHDLELVCRADQIPEELIVDLTGRELGDTIRISDVAIPDGVQAAGAPETVVATLKISSAALAEDADAAADEAATAEAAEAAPEAEADAATEEEAASEE